MKIEIESILMGEEVTALSHYFNGMKAIARVKVNLFGTREHVIIEGDGYMAVMGSTTYPGMSEFKKMEIKKTIVKEYIMEYIRRLMI